MFSKKRPIHESVSRFAEEMERRLEDNDRKGSWEELKAGYISSKILHNLSTTIAGPDAGYTSQQILDSVVDVGNYAMMLHEKLQKWAKNQG